MQGHFLTVLLLCGIASVFAGNLADTVSPCGPDIQVPSVIYVDGCDAAPCEVRNGTVVRFEMTFIAGELKFKFFFVSRFHRLPLLCSRGSHPGSNCTSQSHARLPPDPFHTF